MSNDGAQMLQELIELAEKHSVEKDGEVEGKNLAAAKALSTVGVIAFEQAGWALQHLIGLGEQKISAHSLYSVNKSMPQDDIELNKVEDHKWETAGKALFGQSDYFQEHGIPEPSPSIDNPAAQLQMLWNVLHPLLWGLFPHPLQERLTDAFDIATHGGHTTLFCIDTKSRSYEKGVLELRAVQHRVYRSARWRDPHKTGAAARKFGVQDRTVQAWSKRLRKDKGKAGISAVVASACIARAKEDGTAKRLVDLGQAEEETTYGSFYSDTALAKAGERYKKIKTDGPIF
ncbi:MAG: hypothetical protein IH996_06520 [Proteobacteria bacterium]|nr:hypothetical protein [Pseudomonadota bacterium]